MKINNEKYVVNIFNIDSNLCLTYKNAKNKLLLSNCNDNNIKQQWIVPKSGSGYYINNYNTSFRIYIKNNYTVIADIYSNGDFKNNKNKCLGIYEQDKYLIMDKNIIETDNIRVNMNTCNHLNKDQHWKLINYSLYNNKKTLSTNQFEMHWETLLHSLTPQRECLSENLSSNYFMKGFINNICLNENHLPLYSVKYLNNTYQPSFEYYNKKLFYYLLEKEGFNKAFSRLINTKKNIAIFNFCYGHNYGAVLTAYALQSTLLKLGYNPYLIKNTDKNNLIKSFLDPFWQFEQDNLFTSKDIINQNELKLLNKYYDNFIVGSDQIWRYRYIKSVYKIYFLSFVEKNKKKIACAASFGQKYWEGPERVTKKIKNYIKTFDSITVREKSGVDICKNIFNVKAKAIFDPVFYLKKMEWKKLSEKSTINLNSSCLIYILDRSKRIINQINDITKKVKIPQYFIKNKLTNIYDFLKSIETSQRVITDSFHGLCFSIIFHKDFICLCNKNRGEERFISLLSDLGLMNRLFYDLSEVDWAKLSPINYSKIEKIIEKKRQEGLEFLSSNLEN